MSSNHLRRTAALLAVAAVLSVFGALAPASADPIKDKAEEARRIAARLDELQQQESKLGEAYDQGRLEIQRIEAKVAANQRALAASKKQLAARQQDLARYAVSAYANGGEDQLALILASKPSSSDPTAGYLSATGDHKTKLIDAVKAAKAAQTAAAARLEQAHAKAVETEADVAELRTKVQAMVVEQQQVKSQVDGELQVLLVQEQARLAAEAERKLLAELAARDGFTWTGADEVPPDPNSPGAAVIRAAQTRLGAPYVWAASGPGKFDCSGLVLWSYRQAGLGNLPHSSAAMYAMSQHVALQDAQPGDLVFYGSPVHHVAIYVGGGRIIHAPQTGDVVKYASMFSLREPPMVGRLPRGL